MSLIIAAATTTAAVGIGHNISDIIDTRECFNTALSTSRWIKSLFCDEFTLFAKAMRRVYDDKNPAIPKEYHEDSFLCRNICPITNQPIRYPMVSCSGRSFGVVYEGAAIKQWLSSHSTVPGGGMFDFMSEANLKLDMDLHQQIEKRIHELSSKVFHYKLESHFIEIAMRTEEAREAGCKKSNEYRDHINTRIDRLKTKLPTTLSLPEGSIKTVIGFPRKNSICMRSLDSLWEEERAVITTSLCKREVWLVKKYCPGLKDFVAVWQDQKITGNSVSEQKNNLIKWHKKSKTSVWHVAWKTSCVILATSLLVEGPVFIGLALFSLVVLNYSAQLYSRLKYRSTINELAHHELLTALAFLDDGAHLRTALTQCCGDEKQMNQFLSLLDETLVTIKNKKSHHLLDDMYRFVIKAQEILPEIGGESLMKQYAINKLVEVCDAMRNVLPDVEFYEPRSLV